MPRVYRKPKEIEILLIREFVGSLGFGIANAVWQERPDALLTLRKGKNCRVRIGLELTEYFNDTQAGKRSPLTPMAQFWRHLESSIIRRVSHRPHLTGLAVGVWLKPALPSHGVHRDTARQLARELIAFLEAHPVELYDHEWWTVRDFGGYANLTSRVVKLSVARRTNEAKKATRCSWRCPNITTGNIGLDLRNVASAIQKKNKKAIGYENWDAAKEKWLLISASGQRISNHAGPIVQDEEWADNDLGRVCRESPFDRIVFWERSCRWHKWLKADPKIGRC